MKSKLKQAMEVKNVKQFKRENEQPYFKLNTIIKNDMIDKTNKKH